MSTVVTHPTNGAVAADDPVAWRSQTRVFLQPIAAPSILGLFGFAGATFMVAANMAGWFGTAASGQYIFPFAAVFGGLAQFLAGMWAYRARDAIATAMHGMWGSFWIAYGILWTLVAARVLTLPATGAFSPLGYWFLVLATITACGAIAAVFENLALFSTLGVLAAGSALTAVHYLTGIHGWQTAAGWVLLVAAWIATYTAFAMMLESASGRVILPLGKVSRARNLPGRPDHIPLEFALGEPGVRHGQ
ncbi:MAG TPA: GPR1/FUN34/YaaH family transporter [Solirubrobacteraceae bacterium]